MDGAIAKQISKCGDGWGCKADWVAVVLQKPSRDGWEKRPLPLTTPHNVDTRANDTALFALTA